MLVHMETTGDVIGSREACQILQIDKSTLSRWVSAGKVNPLVKMPARNGAMVFARADIEALRTSA